MIRHVLISLMMISTSSFAQSPCVCCSDDHKAFDFWLGDWKVTTPDGKTAGHNSIQKRHKQCMISERYKTATGFSGSSINFYDPERKLWRQIWLDNQGTILELEGERSGNQMILSSQAIEDAVGQRYVNRITWTANDDGTVRQLWETVSDGGSTTIVFDGLYQKQSPEKQ